MCNTDTCTRILKAFNFKLLTSSYCGEVVVANYFLKNGWSSSCLAVGRALRSNTQQSKMNCFTLGSSSGLRDDMSRVLCCMIWKKSCWSVLHWCLSKKLLPRMHSGCHLENRTTQAPDINSAAVSLSHQDLWWHPVEASIRQHFSTLSYCCTALVTGGYHFC